MIFNSFTKPLAWIKFHTRLLRHKLSGSDRSFWAWLYLRVNDRASIDFGDEMFVKFLIFMASKTNEHIRVCSTYKQFPNVLENEENSTLLQMVSDSASAIGDIELHMKTQQLLLRYDNRQELK